MLTFAYQARDPLGELIEGTLEVASRDEALARSSSARGLACWSWRKRRRGFDLMPRRIRQADIIFATSQLAVMVDTGITLSAALDSIAQQEANPALQASAARSRRTRVESGDDFSTALSRHPQQFDKTFISLIKASEQTGTLGRDARNRRELSAQPARNAAENPRGHGLSRGHGRAGRRRDDLPADLHPAEVRAALFAQGREAAKDHDLHDDGLERAAQLLALLADRRRRACPDLRLWPQDRAGTKILDWLKINLPIIGTMSRKVTLSRSVRTLGTMVASGVSMLDAIRLTAEVASQLVLRAGLAAGARSGDEGSGSANRCRTSATCFRRRSCK